MSFQYTLLQFFRTTFRRYGLLPFIYLVGIAILVLFSNSPAKAMGGATCASQMKDGLQACVYSASLQVTEVNSDDVSCTNAIYVPATGKNICPLYPFELIEDALNQQHKGAP